MKIITSFLLSAVCIVAGFPILAAIAAIYTNILEYSRVDLPGGVVAVIGLAIIARIAWAAATSSSSWIERHFTVNLAASIFILKLLFLALHTGYPQLADHGIFLGFVNQLARAGFSAEEMTLLSASYDYYIWVSRGFPFLHPMALWFPEYHVVAASVLNAGLQSITLLLLDRVSCRLGFDEPTRRTGLILLALIPFHWWQMLEYGHHILSTALILGVIVVVLCLLDARSWWQATGWALCAGLLLVVLALQLGVDQLAFLLAGATIFFTLCSQRPFSKEMLMRSVAGLLMAGAIWQGGKSAYFDWQASFDEHRLSAGLSGFMARGWSVEQLGEYDGRYEQIDRITPVDQKRDAMMAMVASRIHEQPLFSFGILIPVKIAKYSLLGFATTAEDALTAMERPGEAALYRWLRLIHAPLFAFLVLAGVFRLFAVPAPSTLIIPAVFMVIACGIFTFMGETSPRYSIYVQPAMALMAGYGLTGMVSGSLITSMRAAFGRLTCYVPLLLALYGACAVSFWLGTKYLPQRLIMSPLAGEGGVSRISNEPFAVGLNENGTLISGLLPPGRAGFYVWPRMDGAVGELVVRDETSELLRRSLITMPGAGYYEVVLLGPSRLQFDLSGGRLERIGYVRGGF